MSARLAQTAATFPVIVLTGARQAGKTTLLRHTFPNHTYLSLDLPSVAEMADLDPDAFFRRFPGPLLIDEVQYAPGLFRHLKSRIDADRHTMGRYILTGSQRFPLMQAVSESLAGRAAVLGLETLSAAEAGLRTDADYPLILHRGMFPELWRLREMDTLAFYSSYVSTYLERDVRQVLNVSSLRDFERFLRACAVRSGQLLNLSDLARDVGIRVQTARDWLSVLETTNQIHLLEPYFENIGKRIVKSPKLYLADTGLLCFLLGLDAASLRVTPLVGLVWETFVCAEFRKRHATASTPLSLWFYRDAQGREIDFVEMGGGRLNLYEVKWAEEADERWLSNLHEVAAILARGVQQPGDLRLICRTRETYRKNGVLITTPADRS
ncbi:MAG: ATP-binding protein [Acidobacteria bacterium]|nr:ATP-binding protein [Acidobacteriota bacterium]